MKGALSPEVCQTAEGQLYLDKFRELEPGKLAVIKIGGGLIEDEQQLDLISSDMAALHSLGLFPSIVHGAGPQIDTALKDNGFLSAKNGGIRVTRPEHMPCIDTAISSTGKHLSGEINEAIAGTDPNGLSRNLEYIFLATLENDYDLGSVDSITDIDLDLVKECINDGRIPVISSIGKLAASEEIESMPVNINADIAAAALAKALKPEKYISLTTTGAVLDADGEPISKMSVEEAMSAITSGTIKDGMKVKVEEGLRLIGSGVHDFVITSPKDLLRELFTSEGSGTLIAQEG